MARNKPNIRVSLVQNARYSKKIKDVCSLKSAFAMIRGEDRDYIFSNRIEKARELGKNDPDKKYTLYNQKGTFNYYQHLKLITPAFCWSLKAGEGTLRHLNSLTDDDLSGLIYYDIDSYEIENGNIEDLKNIVKSCPSVYAVWKSFGGNGLGLLVKVRGLTVDNFLSTWHNVKDILDVQIQKVCTDNDIKLTYNFDSVTKDFTRINILTYDPDLYVADYKMYDELEAFYGEYSDNSPNKKYKPIAEFKRRYVINGIKVNPVVYVEDYCSFVMEKILKDESSFREDEGRLTYLFFQRYFSMCNLIGIEMDDAFKYLCNRNEDPDNEIDIFSYRNDGEIYEIGTNQYNSYSEQYGTHLTLLDDYQDVTVKEINKTYEGTYDEIAVFIYYHINKYRFNNPNISFNKTDVKSFFSDLKKKGIEKHYITEFITTPEYESVFSPFHGLLKSVYKNPYIPFGVVFDYTEEQKKNKLDQYIMAAKDEGYNVVDIECEGKAYDEDFAGISDIDSMQEYLEAVVVIYTKRGFTFQQIVDVIDDKYYQNILDSPYIKLVEAVYAENKHLKGYVVNHIYDNEKNYKIDQHFFLEENQYLSSITIPEANRRIIWADTGLGKTTYVCSNVPEGAMRIVLVPTIPLLRSIQAKFEGIDVYYSDEKTIHAESRVIVCTFKSFPNLLKDLEYLSDIHEWELHVDEAHYFATATSKEYMNSELNFIYDTLDLFKNVTLYTGTWVKILAPKLNGTFKIYRVRRNAKKKITNVIYQNKMVSTEKLCNKDALNFIYLQSTNEDGLLGRYVNYFEEKGWPKDKMVFLNSKNKDSDEFETLINTELINERYNLVFCTSVAAEGININNLNVETLHFCSNESPHIIEQVASRFRKKTPEFIYTYESASNVKSAKDFFGIEKIQSAIISKTQKTQNMLNFHTNNSKAKSYISSEFLKANNEIDYLLIANEAYEAEKKYANKNFNYMATILQQNYGWEIGETIIIDNKAEKEIMKRVKIKTDESRSIKTEKIFNAYERLKTTERDVKAIEDGMKNISFNVVENAVTNESSINYEMYNIRKNILEFTHYMSVDSAYKIADLWAANNFTAPYLETIKYKINRVLVHQNNNGRADVVTSRFYKNLKKYYEKTKNKSILYTEALYLKTLSELFEVNVTSIEQASLLTENMLNIGLRQNKAGKPRYEILGVNPEHEIAYEKQVVNSFIDQMLKEDKKFTKTEIYAFLKSAFQPTILIHNKIVSSKFTLSDAFNIFASYCDLEERNSKYYKIKNKGCPLFESALKPHFKKIQHHFIEQLV